MGTIRNADARIPAAKIPPPIHKIVLHPSAYDISEYKGAQCQIKAHGCLSLAPACLLHHIGLVNRPYMGISGKKDRESSEYHSQQTLFFLYSCHNFLL